MTAVRFRLIGLVLGLGALAACGHTPDPSRDRSAPAVSGAEVAVLDTTVDATIEAAGTAEPFQRAVLSSKLMGTVLEVRVRAGDRVRAGQILARLDTRDLAAKDAQVRAAMAGAEAAAREAALHATRIRGLYADSAAPRAMLDAADAAQARAEAGLEQARAQQAELAAIADYGVIRAPFAGRVTLRQVDPGSLAAPGAPLLVVEDASRLRLSVNAAPDALRGLRPGSRVPATVEARPVDATIEGIVPAAGNLYEVRALVKNSDGALLSGSTATLSLPVGRRRALLVPAAAIVRQGDLTGLYLRTASGPALRWVRLGREVGSRVEVLAGISRGDRVIVPVRPVAEPR
ncbi:MAG: efflux RND transporter periplasmic adaptor subunit [Gemmatimonadota bacterium]